MYRRSRRLWGRRGVRWRANAREELRACSSGKGRMIRPWPRSRRRSGATSRPASPDRAVIVSRARARGRAGGVPGVGARRVPLRAPLPSIPLPWARRRRCAPTARRSPPRAHRRPTPCCAWATPRRAAQPALQRRLRERRRRARPSPQGAPAAGECGALAGRGLLRLRHPPRPDRHAHLLRQGLPRVGAPAGAGRRRHRGLAGGLAGRAARPPPACAATARCATSTCSTRRARSRTRSCGCPPTSAAASAGCAFRATPRSWIPTARAGRHGRPARAGAGPHRPLAPWAPRAASSRTWATAGRRLPAGPEATRRASA